MIHRTARERLLFEAKDAPPGVRSLDGIRGHTASLEPSVHGPARIVRIRHQGVEVSWAFSLAPNEPRPQFYPPDLPFLASLASEVVWDDERGLVARWTEALTAERQDEFRSALSAFKEVAGDRVGDASLETRRSALEASRSQAIVDRRASTLAEIISFHEGTGWVLRKGHSVHGPFENVTLVRDGVVRTVSALALGIVVVSLEEGPARNDA